MKGCQLLTALFSLFVLVLWGGWLFCPTVANHHGLCRRLKFSTNIDGYTLQGHVIKNISLIAGPSMRSTCTHYCLMEPVCVSVNIGPPNDVKFNCELSDSDHTQHPGDLKPQKGFMYIGTENPCLSQPCLHNSTCLNGFTDKQYLCECQDGYVGEQCEKDFNVVFTNLGASGRNGPTSLGNHYTGQDHDGQVTLSGGIQRWTVPYTGKYQIEAVGAAGGYDVIPGSDKNRGRGARMTGTFNLSKGEIIQILVGQEGEINTNHYSAGGGGGTFVVRGNNTPLIIAGGGGGLQYLYTERHEGCDANTTTAGNPGYKSWSGGKNGHGAQIADDGISGGGGGGFYSSGRSSTDFGGSKGNGGEGGKGFLQGGVGGRALFFNVDGGFGGGGGAQGYGRGGGGGGGYSGGSSGNDVHISCGGGGGSYNVGKDQQNECCFKAAGHGQVNITLVQTN
ncbi:hypothetical protein ACROYT_G015754 [Oculina patagonica]